MKCLGGIGRDRWRFFLMARCTRLVAALGCAIRRRTFSAEPFTGASWRLDNAERQSSAWIARLNADDVSHEDLRHFEIWRDLHADHAHAFEKVDSTWIMLQALQDEIDGHHSWESKVPPRRKFDAGLQEAKPQFDA